MIKAKGFKCTLQSVVQVQAQWNHQQGIKKDIVDILEEVLQLALVFGLKLQHGISFADEPFVLLLQHWCEPLNQEDL